SDLAGVSFSFTAHAKDIYTSPPEILKAKLRAARFVVTCTQYNAEHLADLAGHPWAGRIHRIYHGVDLDRFRSNGSRGLQRGRPGFTCLSIGRLVEKKGFAYLVEAARILTARGRQVSVRIVGGGDQRKTLEVEIARSGLRGAVELTGQMPQEEL